jgi:two-component system cell cycle response regulator DivK
MNSRFYYPTNTGSLGGPRRPSCFMAPMERRTSAPLEADHHGTCFAKPTVLVVEDDDNSLFVLKSILGTKGYRVLEASDGKQAIEVAQAEKLDLILLDLQLPRLNGLGVIHHLRENANLESLPIVIMTGHDPEKYRGSAIAAGCDDFLLKPIDFDRLEAVLDYFVPLRASSWDAR